MLQVPLYSFCLFLLNAFYFYGAEEGCINDGTLVKWPIFIRISKVFLYVTVCLSFNLFSIMVSLYMQNFYTVFKCVPSL